MALMKKDEEIKQDVVNQLTWDSRVDASDVKVKVDNGKVIMTGSTPTYSALDAADDVVWNVLGVTGVDNQLNVTFPTGYTVPSDDDIKDQVERSLNYNAEVEADDITVSVEAGLVTLEGTVTSYWSKVTAEDTSQQVNGVIDVINKLAVVPTEKITDEVLAERVVDRVESNTTANMDEVDVQLRHGKVTLSGTVEDWETWRRAYDAALFTAGVTDVDDNMIIEASNR